MRGIGILSFVLLIFGCTASRIQNTNDTVFSINNIPVSKDEFVYNLKKNNYHNDSALTREEINDYLSLYINFKLKVHEAKQLGLDTTRSFINEYNIYKDQLTESYLKDDSVINALVEEAFRRLHEEVNVSHILIRVDNFSNPDDTLKGYQAIHDIYRKAISGEDFKELASEYSEDPSAKINGGNLGYFKGLQMVYPFENAAYNTPPGEISRPFKTRFGYHILKVHDKRPSRGKVKVAHIMLRKPNNSTKEDSVQLKNKIYSVYDSLMNGGDWEYFTLRYSQDNNSRNNGGILTPFEVGTIVPAFSEAAFALQHPGDISEPVLTPYGWHIIKLIEKIPPGTFDELKEEIRTKVKQDSRSDLTRAMLIKKLEKENHFQEYETIRSALLSRADSSLLNAGWKYDTTDAIIHTVLFLIEDREYRVKGLFDYITDNQKANRTASPSYYMNSLIDDYIEQELLEYEKSQLPRKYLDYKMLSREYYEGILLFELMDQKVWSKAVSDSTGLISYYRENTGNYQWGPRLKATIFKTDELEVINKVRDFLPVESEKANSGFNMGSEAKKDIVKSINNNSEVNLQVESGLYEKGDHPVIDLIDWQVGNHDVSVDENEYLIYVEEVLPPMNQELEEVRGNVISDYQKYLEEIWISELNSKYNVSVNHEVLEKIYKEFETN